MKQSIDLVREFHEKFNHPIGTTPQVPDLATNQFRAEFMAEEAKETEKAALEGNLIEFADGLGDLQYVLDGWFLNAGLADKKDAILAEIHRSNMTKLCSTEEDAIKSVEHINRQAEIGDEVDYRLQNGYFVIFRIRDGKIGKSIFFEKPNLHPIIFGNPS